MLIDNQGQNMSPYNSAEQINWLKSVKLVFNGYREPKVIKEMCLTKRLFSLNINKKKPIVELENPFKIPIIPKKKKRTGAGKIEKKKKRKLTDMEKDAIVTRNIRKHLLEEPTPKLKYKLKSSASKMTKEIFCDAKKDFRLHASKLGYIMSQQNSIIRHKMRSCVKKLSAGLVNLKCEKLLIFVGCLAHFEVINPIFFKRCLNVYLHNKTEKDIECLLELLEGYGDTWTTKMPSEIVTRFINIVKNNNYSWHVKNKLTNYYEEHRQVQKANLSNDDFQQYQGIFCTEKKILIDH